MLAIVFCLTVATANSSSSNDMPLLKRTFSLEQAHPKVNSDYTLPFMQSFAHNATGWRTGDTVELEWDVWLPGDFNRDGVVNIADVTPIAMHYGEYIGHDPYLKLFTTLGPTPEGPVDAEITIGALSYIACGYGTRIHGCHISAYPNGNIQNIRRIKYVPWTSYDTPVVGMWHYRTTIELNPEENVVLVAADLDPEHMHHGGSSTAHIQYTE